MQPPNLPLRDSHPMNFIYGDFFTVGPQWIIVAHFLDSDRGTTPSACIATFIEREGGVDGIPGWNFLLQVPIVFKDVIIFFVGRLPRLSTKCLRASLECAPPSGGITYYFIWSGTWGYREGEIEFQDPRHLCECCPSPLPLSWVLRIASSTSSTPPSLPAYMIRTGKERSTIRCLCLFTPPKASRRWEDTKDERMLNERRSHSGWWYSLLILSVNPQMRDRGGPVCLTMTMSMRLSFLWIWPICHLETVISMMIIWRLLQPSCGLLGIRSVISVLTETVTEECPGFNQVGIKTGIVPTRFLSRWTGRTFWVRVPSLNTYIMPIFYITAFGAGLWIPNQNSSIISTTLAEHIHYEVLIDLSYRNCLCRYRRQCYRRPWSSPCACLGS